MEEQTQHASVSVLDYYNYYYGYYNQSAEGAENCQENANPAATAVEMSDGSAATEVEMTVASTGDAAAAETGTVNETAAVEVSDPAASAAVATVEVRFVYVHFKPMVFSSLNLCTAGCVSGERRRIYS